MGANPGVSAIRLDGNTFTDPSLQIRRQWFIHEGDLDAIQR